MKIILFGNRGSRPLGASVDSPFERYGGDTTSIGAVCDDNTLVALDTGTGFWKWPYTLKNIFGKSDPYKLNVFYTHYHDDHTAGIPQSPFLFQKGNTIDFYGPDFAPGLAQVFNDCANRPHNPDLSKVYQATRNFHTLAESDPVKTMTLSAGVKVSWLPVPHGFEKSYGYKIEQNGQSICLISDTHHALAADGTAVIDPVIVDFIRGADALIYDSHFSDAEFAANPGLCTAMGHSTGEHGVRLAAAAGVPLFVKHHHDPNKIDTVLDAEMAALKIYGRARGVDVVAAQPSLCLDLSLPANQRLAFIEKQTDAKSRYAAIAPNPPA